MRTRIVPVLLTLGVVGWLSSCATERTETSVDTAAVEQAVTSFNQSFLAALAARDTTTIGSAYAEDGILMPPNAPRVDGRDAIRSSWAQLMADTAFSLTFQSNRVLVAKAGDMAVDVGTYRARFTGPAGPMDDVGKYSTVLRQDGGEWKIVVDMFNSDQSLGGP